MIPSRQHSRINLTDLKAQIVKKLGPEGSKQYFSYLNRFLSLKLSNIEFTKLCLRILGRDNIPLHNQLIHSIIRNACTSKTSPPAIHKDEISKHGSGNEIRYDSNGPYGGMTQASASLGLSNGSNVLPVSPRKARRGICDRRSEDHLRIPNGKTSFAIATPSSDFNVVLENMFLNSPDFGKDPTNSVTRNVASARSPLRAPLGVSLCSVSIGETRRALSLENSSRFISKSDDGVLLDSFTSREQMEQIALSHCANLLNNGLDSYLKGLIRSCIELVGTRSGHEFGKKNAEKHEMNLKLTNGVRSGQVQNSGTRSISLRDFRVAMELNPRQLGEDWPVLFEKIHTQSFEE